MSTVLHDPSRPQVSDLLALSHLALKLGEIDRATQHPDGRAETDTTHTVMLALLATSLMPYSAVDLSPGLVVHFALVHDLVEAYAGDTNTARGLTPVERTEKELREHIALMRIRTELTAFPWVGEMIDRYEAQKEPEARFVRYLDKVVCKYTHLLNRGSALRAIGMTHAEMKQKHIIQGLALREQYPELSFVAQVFDEACDTCEEYLFRDPPEEASEAPREKGAAEEAFDEIEEASEDVGEDEDGPAWADVDTRARADSWLTEMRELFADSEWREPAHSESGDGQVVYEWREGKRKLCLYVLQPHPH